MSYEYTGQDKIEMNSSNIKAATAALVLCIVVTASALPAELEGLLLDSDFQKPDPCSVCYIFGDEESCTVCKLDMASMTKRSGSIFHPLFRGTFPKKSTYAQYYNPLSRGSYHKKSPYPVYHPFLRGGYTNPYLNTVNQP
ncbi:hypothetical protein MAR_024962 [Mya arenaria]|uniref:Uncharacterized protein n=1 Tax=Mya arenaria TaxID=6604 RepID=A0ABY7DSA8_MYAAR|nr:hypothetical protein MAR_024962 [Mya arenaria]